MQFGILVMRWSRNGSSTLSKMAGKSLLALGLSSALLCAGCMEIAVPPAREYSRGQNSRNLEVDAFGNKPASSGLVEAEYVGEVVELNSFNFHDFIGRGNKVVLFWDDSGPPLYKFVAHDFARAAAEIDCANLGRVDLNANRALESEFRVEMRHGYVPEIFYFKDGNKVESHTVMPRRTTDISGVFDNVIGNCRRFYVNKTN